MKQLGLRERKKLRTRQLIADTAFGLFVQRGFDAVTVAEVAQAADVSEKTVFNYFPTKEDLVYSRMESFEEELLQAVRGRERGESVLTAFSRFVLEPRGRLSDPDAGEELEAITRMITDSPALLRREQAIFERYTASLAALIGAETEAGADAVEPWVAANALIGVHRALIAFVRRRTLDGVRSPQLAREVRAEGEAALAALERGLDAYAVKH